MAPAKASATVKTPAAQKGAMNFRPEVEDGADGTSTGLATLMGDGRSGLHEACHSTPRLGGEAPASRRNSESRFLTIWNTGGRFALRSLKRSNLSTYMAM